MLNAELGLLFQSDPVGEAIMARQVEIYSSMLCGFCYRAKKLLEKKGVAFEEIDVMLSPGKRQEMIQRSGGRTSVPQIFVDGQHLGNCDEIYALESQGKLDTILTDQAGGSNPD